MLKMRLQSAESTDESWKLKNDSLEKEVVMLREDVQRTNKSLEESKNKMEQDLQTWNAKYKGISSKALCLSIVHFLLTFLHFYYPSAKREVLLS